MVCILCRTYIKLRHRDLKGIRQWPINDDTPSVDYYKWLKSLDTQLNGPTNQNSLKFPKVVKPRNKKTLL